MATTGRERLKPWERRLLFRLRELDPVPAAVSVAAEGSFRWRRLDAELAELGLDSASVGGRRLVFVAPRLAVEIEAAGRRLVGQLVPPQRAQIEVQGLHDRRHVEADDLGRFTVDEAGAGAFRLHFYLVDRDAAVETEWVIL